MLRSVIVCEDQDLASRLQCSLERVGGIAILRSFHHYPDSVELSRMLRAVAPDVMFLGTESMLHTVEMVKQIEASVTGVQVVAISHASDPAVLLQAMRIGIREFLSSPFEPDQVAESIRRVYQAIVSRPPRFETSDNVFSFLPSKAGVGTSTIALNVAVALSQVPDSPTILSDFDLNSGMMRFMLKLENSYSVADAAEHAMEMDEALWPPLVTSMGALDVLHAGKLNPGFRMEAPQIRRLMEFMRRNYKALCFDLSGNLEKYSLEIMHESKRVFLVCTSEIPSLYLAREKYAFLKSLDLDGRISVLVNRVAKHPVISRDQIEQILGLPVLMTFPNDYNGVQKALAAGRAIEAGSPLGQGFARLARTLVEKPAPAPPAPVRNRFIQYFSAAPSRAT